MTATSVFRTMAQDASLTGGLLRGVTGPLVKIPLNNSAMATVLAGASTAAFSGSGAILNPDGSSQTYTLTVPATPPNCAGIRSIVHGRTVGVRWRRDNTTTPFDFVVDGVPYAIDNVTARRDNVTQSWTDFEGHFVVNGLTDDNHTVEVHVPSDPTGVTQGKVIVLGWLGERNGVYNDVSPVPRSSATNGSATVTVPTTAATPTFAGPVIGLRYINTDTTNPRTVTVYGPDGTSVYDVVTVPAGTAAGAGVAKTSFPTPRTLTGWKWKVDSGTTVLGWVENA